MVTMPEQQHLWSSILVSCVMQLPSGCRAAHPSHPSVQGQREEQSPPFGGTPKALLGLHSLHPITGHPLHVPLDSLESPLLAFLLQAVHSLSD